MMKIILIGLLLSMLLISACYVPPQEVVLCKDATVGGYMKISHARDIAIKYCVELPDVEEPEEPAEECLEGEVCSDIVVGEACPIGEECAVEETEETGDEPIDTIVVEMPPYEFLKDYTCNPVKGTITFSLGYTTGDCKKFCVVDMSKETAVVMSTCIVGTECPEGEVCYGDDGIVVGEACPIGEVCDDEVIVEGE